MKIRQTGEFELLLDILCQEASSIHNLGGTPVHSQVVIFGMRDGQVSQLFKRENGWELSEWESIYVPEFDWTFIAPFFMY